MSSPSTAQILDVIGTLYDAGLGSGSWQEALAGLAALFGTGNANLVIQCTDPIEASGVIAVGVDDAAVDNYVRYYAGLNPVVPTMSRVPVGSPVTDAMVAPRSATVRGEFYNDWAQPNGFDGALFAVLLRRDTVHGCACISRSSHDNDFDQSHLDLFGLLIPHLQRATQLHLKLAEARSQRTDASLALDHLQLGVLLVMMDGSVCHANREAERILRQSDGLGLRRARLCASTPRMTQALRQKLASTVLDRANRSERFDAANGPGGGLIIERPSGRRPLALLIVPLPHRVATWPMIAPAASAIIFVSDPDQRKPLLPDMLRQLYNLTPREASLAVGIAHGGRLADVADELGIARATARTHLLRVFAKTDTRRQADLVQLIGNVSVIATR